MKDANYYKQLLEARLDEQQRLTPGREAVINRNIMGAWVSAHAALEEPNIPPAIQRKITTLSTAKERQGRILLNLGRPPDDRDSPSMTDPKLKYELKQIRGTKQAVRSGRSVG